MTLFIRLIQPNKTACRVVALAKPGLCPSVWACRVVASCEAWSVAKIKNKADLTGACPVAPVDGTGVCSVVKSPVKIVK